MSSKMKLRTNIKPQRPQIKIKNTGVSHPGCTRHCWHPIEHGRHVCCHGNHTRRQGNGTPPENTTPRCVANKTLWAEADEGSFLDWLEKTPSRDGVSLPA